MCAYAWDSDNMGGAPMTVEEYNSALLPPGFEGPNPRHPHYRQRPKPLRIKPNSGGQSPSNQILTLNNSSHSESSPLLLHRTGSGSGTTTRYTGCWDSFDPFYGQFTSVRSDSLYVNEPMQGNDWNRNNDIPVRRRRRSGSITHNSPQYDYKTHFAPEEYDYLRKCHGRPEDNLFFARDKFTNNFFEFPMLQDENLDIHQWRQEAGHPGYRESQRPQPFACDELGYFDEGTDEV